jgi:hypothetical protein
MTVPLQATISASHEHRTQPECPDSPRAIVTFQIRPHWHRVMNEAVND